MTTSSPGLNSKSFYRKKNWKGFPHLLLGDRRVELLVPTFCLSGRQLEGARRTGGAAAAVVEQSKRLDSNPWHVLQGAAGSEVPAPVLY